ncbi:hypothetical protein ABZV81_26330 [Streptomyces parvus]|uniref:hypothetical protein n=1 Tax=Streptomyces parvus TaxID=66428 RepID=UPI0033A30B4D
MTVVTAPARPLPGPRSAGSQPSRSRFSIGGYRSGRARPDGTLARAGRFAGDGEWSSKGRYRHRTTYGYGDTVALPGPVDITLESEELKNYSG